jgi:hypothetical protein
VCLVQAEEPDERPVVIEDDQPEGGGGGGTRKSGFRIGVGRDRLRVGFCVVERRGIWIGRFRDLGDRSGEALAIYEEDHLHARVLEHPAEALHSGVDAERLRVPQHQICDDASSTDRLRFHAAWLHAGYCLGKSYAVLTPRHSKGGVT